MIFWYLTAAILLLLIFLPRVGLVSVYKNLQVAQQREQVEDALKHLLDRDRGGRNASSESLAGTLDVSRIKTTDLVASMESWGLVHSRDSELHLTLDGERWASLPFPGWLRWVGVFISLFGFILLQWDQNILGNSWSDTQRMLKEQVLITSGPYSIIRHPFYAAFLLILGSTLFITANWLIGFSWVFMTFLEIYSRLHFEDSLMTEYFGNQFREYMQRTGSLFPNIV